MTARKREGLYGWLFAMPWILGFSTFLLYPLLASLYYSFCDYSVLKPPIFNGGHNYAMLFQDELFRKSLVNTFQFAFMALPVGLVVSIAIALLLNNKVRGLSIYRTIYYLPTLVPAIPMAVLWMYLFNGEKGIINIGLTQLFKVMHLPFTPPNWLGDPSWSKPSLVIMGLWGVGNAVVIYLAGLQDVPQSLYEAAEIDGANAWQKTKNVTLPMISGVIQFNFILGIIGTLQVFDGPYIMFPGGAPDRSTYLYTMYLFDNAFGFQKMGYACAMGWILFAIIFVLTMVAMKLTDKKVELPAG